MSVQQEHTGSGDNIAGDKFENIIRSVQTKDLESVIDSIMRDILYRELSEARQKLDVLKGIHALEYDVRLLLNALDIKIELAMGSEVPSKNDLLKLLRQKNLSETIWDVTTSILIDVESRNSYDLAKKIYSESVTRSASFYIKEVYLERLASTEELKYHLSDDEVLLMTEQEITGAVRGAIRAENFAFAFEFANQLDRYFSSTNSKALLLYAQSCLIATQFHNKHYMSFSLKEKFDLDQLVNFLIEEISTGNDRRHIATLTNLLNLTSFSDHRLHDLARLHVDKIRDIHSGCAELVDKLCNQEKLEESPFELTSKSLDLEQFSRLDVALESEKIDTKSVSNWVENGGKISTGDEYLNSFIDLFLSALLCSSSDKKALHSLDERAQTFLENNQKDIVVLIHL